MMRNDNCVIGSADACANIERSGRCVNCGVVRLRRADYICIGPMRWSEECESRVFVLEMGSLCAVCAEYSMGRYQCLYTITPEASGLDRAA
jgi:hypothetical protein